ncbi:hypothetical protein [Dyadobacter luticola]|uniref:Capsular biosynthesis protein n=1 Tax=Dyadobacter luticola TaxID=1979387 RepID=A0A5R9L1X6_9BACT|nr:hypothetical protein [Dyadobacter luticola]TLV02387.1 hypothetical protein FEN17_01750 [Dyadobacter luticola]
MNIAFVANGHKSQFFDLISKSIITKMSGTKIHWICAAKFQYDYIISSGWPAEDVLLLNLALIEGNVGEIIGEYKLHELVYGDRVLKFRFNDGMAYLSKLQSLFYNFVTEKKLRYIFGEMTWAHEILMNRICQDKFENSCFYLHPQSIRIPNGRFSFMDTEYQDTLFKKAEYIHGEDVLNGFELPLKPVVPQRVADVAKDVKHSITFKYKVNRITKFLAQNRFIERPKDNPQSLTIGKAVNKFLTVSQNQYYYTKQLKRENLSILEGKKFFLITLHMQPEASIDVVGRYYEDQYLIIRDVWRILPNDYYLVVKEHTNAIGNRGEDFFKRLKNLRNVIIIHEETSSHQLIGLSETIFTNSGTVALEGALYQKHVFLFSNIFFDKLKYCHRITLEDLKYTSNYFELRERCIERDKEKMSCQEYSEYIIRSSFAGVIDGHKGSPYYTDKANIEKISESFIKFLEQK